MCWTGKTIDGCWESLPVDGVDGAGEGFGVVTDVVVALNAYEAGIVAAGVKIVPVPCCAMTPQRLTTMV